MYKPNGIKVFCDSASLGDFDSYFESVAGFTTNPSLAASAGVSNYRDFCAAASELGRGKPVSLEVISDEPAEMRAQAMVLSAISNNVWVKIPVCNSAGKTTLPEVEDLADEGVNLNITAVFTEVQVEECLLALRASSNAIVSIFSGRIADAGIDPEPHMLKARHLRDKIAPQVELLWASAREIFNKAQAQRSGADIITLGPSLIEKVPLVGKDLHEYSLETAAMFAMDARNSGFSL